MVGVVGDGLAQGADSGMRARTEGDAPRLAGSRVLRLGVFLLCFFFFFFNLLEHIALKYYLSWILRSFLHPLKFCT